ncbi:MAG: DnaA/Hda family protein [Pseudomonadota bacterium]|nr:DnaA/Hda family protein [Pseudomonadota bacterium]
MSKTGQLTFDLPVRPALERADFLIGPCNREAATLIDRWPDRDERCLVVTGPAASGKSHLLAVWQARTGAISLDPDVLKTVDADEILDGTQMWAVSGLEDIAGHTKAEETLFHLYNAARSHGALVISSRIPPSRLAFNTPDLATRLRGALAVAISPPDDLLIAAVLIKQLRDRQVTVRAEVIAYLLPRIERSFAAVRDLVDRLDSAALTRKRAITVPLARSVLEETDTL